MSDLDKLREQHHISIRRQSKMKETIIYRNQLQKNLIISYVNSLDIKNQKSQYNLQCLIDRFTEQRNDIQLRNQMNIFNRDQGIFGLQSHQDFHQLLQPLINYFPIQEFWRETMLIESNANTSLSTYQFRSINMLRDLIFLKKHHRDYQIYLSQINQITKAFNPQTNCYYTLLVIFEINKGYLDCIFQLIKMQRQYQQIVVEQSNDYKEHKKLPQPQQCPQIKSFKPILSQTLIFFKTIMSNSSYAKYISEDIQTHLLEFVSKIIQNCQYYLYEINSRYVKIRIEQLLHSVYIFMSLLTPDRIQKLDFNTLWPKLQLIIGSRFRHFTLYRYVLKIGVKLMRHSDYFVNFLLKKEPFTDLVRSTQRVNLHEVCQCLQIMLKYPKSEIILKSTVIIMILDIPELIESLRQKLFQLMFQFYQKKSYKATDPQSCIILKKVAQNKNPYYRRDVELQFWLSILSNGYKYPIPLYIKDDVNDLLDEKQKEDIKLRLLGKQGCKW